MLVFVFITSQFEEDHHSDSHIPLGTSSGGTTDRPLFADIIEQLAHRFIYLDLLRRLELSASTREREREREREAGRCP